MFYISEMSNLKQNDGDLLENQNIKTFEVFSKPIKKPQDNKI